MKRRRVRSVSSVFSSSSGRPCQRSRIRVAASNIPGARYTAPPRIRPRIAITRNATSSPFKDARITPAMVTDPPLNNPAGRATDVPAIVELLARCDATIAEWAPAGWTAPTMEGEAKRLAERMGDPETAFIVAAGADGVALGFATFRPADSPERGKISNLFVDPRAW